ncbi:MAG TPA: MMPL family transporter [Bacteriovoracaceae bacterium]|nr:MMPL family transporter [Bacteriovoracaceae bacterium]
MTDLLPDNRESVLDMNSVIKEVGGVGYMIVLLGPVDNPEKYLPVIADSIKNNSQIRYFFYEREEYLLQDRALYLLSKKEFNDLRKHASNLFSDEENSSSLLDLGLEEDVDLKDKKEEAKKYFEKFRREKEVKKRYYLSKDGRYAMFLIKPSFDSVDLDSSSKLAADLNAALKSALGDIKFNLIGRYIEKVHDRDQFNRDIVRTGTITFVALSFILVLGLGTFRGALVTNVAVIISLGWTVGIALLFVGRINILTSFLLAILGGLGAEYGIHLLRRYFQARQEGMSAEEGINFTYDNMGRALFSAAVTSAAAFLILYISDFRGFSELGVIAGLGILAIFFVYIMAFPLIGKWLGDAPRFSKTAALFGFYPFSIGWKWIYFPVALLLAYGLRHAEFEYDFERMHDLTKETQKMNSLASKLFGKSLVPAALQVTDYDQTMELAEWLKESRQQRYVQDVVTISSLVPDDMSSRYRKMQKLKKMIEKTSPAEIEEKTGLRYDKVIRWVSEAPYTKDDLPPQLQNAFGQEGTIVLAYPKEQQTTAAALQNFAKLLRTAKKKFPGLKVGSDTLVFVEILDHIMVDGKVVLALFALGAFLVFWLDFRSFYSALLLESQLVVGMILLVAAMGLFGVRFTILNVAMIPAVLAAGIDMGVHIRHRELETLGEGESSSVASARYIAQAVHLSALTTIVGFGSLFFAEAGMLKGIAWISVLGQVSMYLVCMVLFPIFRDGIAIVKRNYAK